MISLVPRASGGYDLLSDGTPNLLHRVAQAWREGAVRLADADELREMERLIMADRDRLLAQAEALLAEIRSQREAC
jgi:hypothetical protein